RRTAPAAGSSTRAPSASGGPRSITICSIVISGGSLSRPQATSDANPMRSRTPRRIARGPYRWGSRPAKVARAAGSPAPVGGGGRGPGSCWGAEGGLDSWYVPYMVPGMLALYLSYVGAPGEDARLPRRLLAYGVLVAYVCLHLAPRSVDYRRMRYYQVGKER